MELSRVTVEMESAIQLIKADAARIYGLAHNKAKAIAEREKQISIFTLKRRDEKMPVGMIQSVVRGDCAEYTLNAETHEGVYRACLARIEANKAILNGLQSILRVQEEIDKRT